MGQRAGGPHGRIELLGARDRMDRVSRIRPLDRDEALRLLRGSKLDPAEMAEIRRWSFEQGLGVKRTDEGLLAEIAEAACAGRIVLAARRRIVSASDSSGTSAQHDRTETQPDRPIRPARPHRPERPTLPPAPETTEVQTWVEFRLFDETTGEPVSGVGFRIQLPEGTIERHITDGDGLIRIDGIDPGFCGIREIVADTGPEVTKVM